jgi:hypothetical protein
VLQSELSKRSLESERQTQQLKGMLNQLSESAENQSKMNNAKDVAVSEMHRARHELQEMKSNGASTSQDMLSRDAVIQQLKQERAAELSQFCVNLGQIESALVEMQRKEARYINEIPLHDTINESSRARDELTKFVGILKLQLNTKIADSANSNFLKPSTSVNSISNLSNLLGMAPDTDVFGSPIRSAFSAQTPAFLPNGFLGGGSSSQGSALLHDDFSLDFSSDSLFAGVANGSSVGPATSKILGAGSSSSSVLGSALLAGSSGGSAASVGTSNTMVCALPGCHAEGTFICSACNRSGYCGAQHQRYIMLRFIICLQ